MRIARYIMLAALLFVTVPHVFADEDHAEDHYNGKDKHSKSSRMLKVVKNEAYLKECGACHFAYQPELLPIRSWQKIMDTLDKHFGTDASLPEDSKAELHKYLTEGSAEKSSVKNAQRLLKSISPDETPARISEIKFFKKEHRKIRPEVLQRKAIGSISNCAACHTTADKGDYDEDLVRIPKK